MLRYLLMGMLVSLAGFAAESQQFQQARQSFERTNYDACIRILQQPPPRSGTEWNLIGRAYFMLGELKRATESFEKAVSVEPRRSEHWQWLGRTYGRRAESSSFVSAPGYASKACQNFERAVALDDRNIEALNDLFEYYLQAPGFLGGGLQKAEVLIDKIAAVDPVERHWALSRLAEERKDFQTAEFQLRRCFELAPRQMGRAVDLAKFLARRGRTSESEQVFEKARQIDPQHPTYLWERASLLVEQKRNPEEARRLLQQYLAIAVKPEDDHKMEARQLLARLTGA